MFSKMLSVVVLALVNSLMISSIPNQLNTDYNKYLIYGKITTHEGETYQGQIRWGKEEAFWFDHFNSSKPKNDNLKWLSDEEIDELNEKDKNSYSSKWSNIKILSWNNSYHDEDHTHTFSCQFGDIKSLKLLRRSKVVVELKNGEEIMVQGGSNDIGEDVKIRDEEIGNIKLKWEHIDKVEFMPTPSGMESSWGDPLYGTVKTHRESYTGFVQWDHDERLSHDELNGDTDDGELDIEFSKIKSIESTYRGCDVELKSGRSFRLTGSNDVDKRNRGIIVNIPDFGRVDIEWNEFESVDFSAAPTNMSLSYQDFKGENKITGTITDVLGDVYSGELIYDLDERYTLEMLDGKVDDLEYMIPFNNIDRIIPLNREETKVLLKNGSEYILEDKVDVNERNDGILVFDKNGDPTYIPWKQVEEVKLNNIF